MRRFLVTSAIILAASSYGIEIAFSQEASPDSMIRGQNDVIANPSETIQPVNDVTKAKPAMPAPALSPKLEGFSLYNFGAAYFYSRQKITEYDWWDGTSYTYNYTTTIFAAGASWNYMVYEGLSLGGSLGLITLGYSSSPVNLGYISYSGYSHSSTITLVGPRIAKYFGNRNSKAWPYIAGEMDIITSSSVLYSDSETLFRLGGGVVFKMKPSVGLSLGLDYLKFEDQKDAVNIMGTLGLVYRP